MGCLLAPPDLPPPAPAQLQAQKLRLAHSRGPYYSGSLPNVNQIGSGVSDFQVSSARSASQGLPWGGCPPWHSGCHPWCLGKRAQELHQDSGWVSGRRKKSLGA